MTSFLKTFYLDDSKLAQRALLEFHRALATGRLIAFTGAMTTEPAGYGSWTEFGQFYVDQARQIADDPAIKADDPSRVAIASMVDRLEDTSGIDLRVAFGLVEEALAQLDLRYPDYRLQEPDGRKWAAGPAYFQHRRKRVRVTRLEELRLRASEYFRSPGRPKLDDGCPFIELLADLGVRRFATLNYDLELEAALMLGDRKVERSVTDNPFESLRALSAKGEVKWRDNRHTIHRLTRAGLIVESDILDRERIDRMIEFALGGDDVDFHIMHLHGRCCTPASMIISYRDYDRLYRRQDLYRLPFEYGQRIMVGGNAIVFVGLGMSEAEVNQQLEQFVSDNPYHRVSPTFLLWNASRDGKAMTEREITRRRIDWLHRLGVLTIFSSDVPPAIANAPLPGDKPVSNFGQLSRFITDLPEAAAKIARREEHADGPWRNMQDRVTARRTRPVILWSLADMDARSQGRARLLRQRCTIITDRLISSTMPIAVWGPSGSGKGSLAFDLTVEDKLLVEASWPRSQRMLINASFSFDSDSMLDLVTRFISAVSGVAFDGQKISRRQFLSTPGVFTTRDGTGTIIIINGMERFFDTRGILLSSEFDELMHLIAKSFAPKNRKAGQRPIQWVFFGTIRIRKYMQQCFGKRLVLEEFQHDDSAAQEQFPSIYLSDIRKGFDKGITPASKRRIAQEIERYRGLSAGRISGDIDSLRGQVFDAYLAAPPFSGPDGAILLETLRVISFVGTPVEAEILYHAPRLVALVESGAAGRKQIDAAIAELVDISVVIPVFPFAGYQCDSYDGGLAPPPRLALHRSLLTELRFRFGIPLSEAKLSTAFNMSLYVAQPVDGLLPEPAIHDELGLLIDRLIGAYRDWPEPCPADLRATLQPLKRRGAPDSEIDCLYTLCLPRSAQCLRAALAVLRGYYTTTGLLTLDAHDRLIRDDRDAILLEHGERLDSLLDAFGKLSAARNAARGALGDTFAQRFGCGEPFYADDLVWLHNERGVVQLIMGDLYEARRSLNLAMRINRNSVEYTDRGHNWRRIRLNQLTLDTESGDFSLAERKIAELIELSDVKPPLREDELATAIATGYRGWTYQLRGDRAKAERDFNAAIDILHKLEEARAIAYFQRLRSMLPNLAGRFTDTDSAIDIAESTRQMDIAYRTRIAKADRVLSSAAATPADRRAANRMLEDALFYSLQTDTHRVRIEAGRVLANVRLASGDFDGALRYATDAAMIAARYGIETRRITLRTLIGRIMAHRGHPLTGRALIATSIKAATRRKYQTAIDAAEEALLEIPSIAR